MHKGNKQKKFVPAQVKLLVAIASTIVLVIKVVGGCGQSNGPQVIGSLNNPSPQPKTNTLGWDELIATSDDWSRLTTPIPSGCNFSLYEDGCGWVKFPNGEIREIGPTILVNWPNIPNGSFRFKARDKPIKVKVVWQPISP